MKSFLYLKSRSILCVPFLLLLTASIATMRVNADPLPYVSVYPPTAIISAPNATSKIEVVVHDVTDCYGVDFWLSYNSTLIQRQGLVNIDGPFDSGNPPIRPDPDAYPGGYVLTQPHALGIIKVSLTFVGALGAPSFNGTGTVCAITFKGLAFGISNLTFDESKTKIWNPAGSPQPRDPCVNGEISVIPEFSAAIIIELLIATLAAAFMAKITRSRKR